jgi:hypothetical protein
MPVIPVTREAEIKRIAVRGWPGQKLVVSYINQETDCGSGHLFPSYMGDVKSRIEVQAGLHKNAKPSLEK